MFQAFRVEGLGLRMCAFLRKAVFQNLTLKAVVFEIASTMSKAQSWRGVQEVCKLDIARTQ